MTRQSFASTDLDRCGPCPNPKMDWIVYTKESSTAVLPPMTSSSSTLTSFQQNLTSQVRINTRRVQFAPLPAQLDRGMRMETVLLHTPIAIDSTQQSMIEQRAKQVNEMIAGMVKSKSNVTEPWPDPSPKMLQNWIDRHPSYHSFSSHYMSSQRRMLFLADIDPSKRFEAFEAICFNRVLAPTTAETRSQRPR